MFQLVDFTELRMVSQWHHHALHALHEWTPASHMVVATGLDWNLEDQRDISYCEVRVPLQRQGCASFVARCTPHTAHALLISAFFIFNVFMIVYLISIISWFQARWSLRCPFFPVTLFCCSSCCHQPFWFACTMCVCACVALTRLWWQDQKLVVILTCFLTLVAVNFVISDSIPRVNHVRRLRSSAAASTDPLRAVHCPDRVLCLGE